MFLKKIRTASDATEKDSSDTLWHIFNKVKKGCAQKPDAFVAQNWPCKIFLLT